MKSKYLFLAAAMPLVFTACQNDEFAQESVIGQDKMGTLIEAPLLGIGVEMGDASTRVYEVEGIQKKWAWKPTVDADQTPKAVSVDKIGLCWTGVNEGGKYEGPAKETGDMVYTNVKFNHVGWLYTGEENPKLHCGELQNGEFHDFDSNLQPQAKWSSKATFFEATATGKTLDFSKGMFKSGNGTIYEGEYIVYFPYNDSFWNAPVTAKQERLLDLTIDKNNKVADPLELMSKYAFNVGYKNQINGGKEACDFSTRILTSGIKFNISASADNEIKEIVLWSKGEKAFKTSQALSAKAIKAALTTGAGLSTAVYMNAEGNEASSTLVVRTEGLKITNSNNAEFYVPFLPNTFKDLNILLVREDGTVAVLTDKLWKEIEFEANAPKNLKLYIEEGVVYKERAKTTKVGEFSSVNYAYDEPSFEAAYAKAFENASKQDVAPRTVVMLDDITLTEYNNDLKYGTSSVNNVIIESDPTLVEGEHNVLTLAGNEVKAVTYQFRTTTFDVDVQTQAQGCCNGGLVNLLLGNKSATKEGTALTVNGGVLKLELQLTLNGDVYSLFESKDEEGELHADRIPTVIVNAENADAVVTATGKFVNEGKLTVVSNKGTKKKGELNLVGAEFVNGTENTTLNEQRASIEVQGIGEEGKDGVIRMSNNATLANNGDIYNHGNIDNNSVAGSFTNEANATFTDYVGSSLSGRRIVNKENAEFICEVNSLVRYNNAIDLNGIRPTTIVRFVYGENVNIGTGTFTTEYTLAPQEGKDGIYVPYNTNEQLVKFESAIDNKVANTIQALTLNHKADGAGKAIATKIGDVKVKSGRITINHEALTIDGDYTAEKGALNTNLPKGIAKITGDMNLSTTVLENQTGNVTLGDSKTLNIDGNLNAIDIAAGLTFNKNSVLNVGGNINITKVADGTNFEMGTKVAAKNMTVAAGENVKFAKNNVTYLGKDDAKNGVLTNNGAINIENAVSGSDVAAKVWCNKRAGNGTYANNSYPQYY